MELSHYKKEIVPLNHWFSAGDDFATKGYLAMSGDISVVTTRHLVERGQRCDLTFYNLQDSYPQQLSSFSTNGTEVEKSCFNCGLFTGVTVGISWSNSLGNANYESFLGILG